MVNQRLNITIERYDLLRFRLKCVDNTISISKRINQLIKEDLKCSN